MSGDKDVYTRLAKFYANSEYHIAESSLSGSYNQKDIVREMLTSSGNTYFTVEIPINTSLTKKLKVYPLI